MAGNGSAASPAPRPGPPEGRFPYRNQSKNGVAKYDLEHGQQFKTALSWADVDATAIVDAIVAATDVGDALMFSRTSDGGAYSITVMSGGKSAKVWPSEPDQCADVLRSIIERAAQ